MPVGSKRMDARIAVLAILLLAGACARSAVPAPAPAPPPPPPPPLPAPAPAPEIVIDTLRYPVPDMTGLTQDQVYARLAGYPYQVQIVWSLDTVVVRAGDTHVTVGMVLGQRVEIDESRGAVILYFRVADRVVMSAPTLPVDTVVTDVPVGSSPPSDADRDGVPDDEDLCPTTPLGVRVIDRGCPLDDLIDMLPRGVYAFNVRDSMVVGSQYTIVLILKPFVDAERATSDAAMRATVVSVLEEAGSDTLRTDVEIRERPFADEMVAQLTGPDDWSIQLRAGYDTLRSISRRDSTVWMWDVTPQGCAAGSSLFSLACREEILTLHVYAKFGETTERWPLIHEPVHVRVTLARKLSGVAAASVPWLLALLALFAGLIWWSNRRRVTILFLAANPDNTSRLNLEEEMRAIRAALQKGRDRKRFRIEQCWGVRATDLDDVLLEHKPEIVHISAHGNEANELIVEEDTSRDVRRSKATPRTHEPVSPESLSRVFAPLKGTVRCVVLNACYSEAQAMAISQHVDCVIGMSRSIGDSAAINFSSGFYLALAHGKKVEEAFQLACSEIQRAALIGDDVPRLIGKEDASMAFVRSDTTH